MAGLSAKGSATVHCTVHALITSRTIDRCRHLSIIARKHDQVIRTLNLVYVK
jgi:hypothetical protein